MDSVIGVIVILALAIGLGLIWWEVRRAYKLLEKEFGNLRQTLMEIGKDGKSIMGRIDLLTKAMEVVTTATQKTPRQRKPRAMPVSSTTAIGGTNGHATT